MTPNVAAFLSMIAHSEGVDRPPAPPDPYRTCYGYKHVIIDLTYHPHQMRTDGTREWGGEKLTDEQCAHVGLHPGCVSTAAGRYQITWGTFDRLQGKLGVRDFMPATQDDLCVELVKEVGALAMVNAGKIGDAVPLCSHLWASLPGNTSGQPQTRFADLMRSYVDFGGGFA